MSDIALIAGYFVVALVLGFIVALIWHDDGDEVLAISMIAWPAVIPIVLLMFVFVFVWDLAGKVRES